MKYSQKEWLSNVTRNADHKSAPRFLYAEKRGDQYIGVAVEMSWRDGNLSGWGRLCADTDRGWLSTLKGDKRFVLEADGTISLAVDEPTATIAPHLPPVAWKTCVSVAFDKWVEDYLKVYNLNHPRYRIVSLALEEVEIGLDGQVRAFEFDYDNGRWKAHGHRVDVNDVLVFTYGLVENDLCDEWTQFGCCANSVCHAYATLDGTIRFNGDTSRFHYNKGYDMGAFGGKCGLGGLDFAA